MISFIVPAYNEAYLLGRTVDSIHFAATRLGIPYEVLVVDDHSDDATAKVAKEHKARVIPVRHRQIAATRNSGARQARGQVFIFVDADTVISTFVLSETIDALMEGVAGGGAAIEFDGRIPWYGKMLEWLVCRLYRYGRIASGSYLFCTREAFEETGGFDERVYGAEEAGMCRALKKCGRFMVLRERVLTSGRKFRLHTFAEVMATLLRVTFHGGRIARKKSARIWYRPRREPPGGDS